MHLQSITDPNIPRSESAVDEVIEQCRENFGDAPRRFVGSRIEKYLSLPVPDWARDNPEERLRILFRRAADVFANGRIVWGHVVQANGLMFQPGPISCPGEVVFSMVDSPEVDPVYLAGVARALYGLKGTRPRNRQARRLADHFTDEWTRVFGAPVPSSFGAIRCRVSTTFFTRKHLPDRRLCSTILPIVVNPEKPLIALPLPERYWPEEFADWWVG